MIITRQPVSTAPLLVGETASFSCEAKSNPVSRITWFRVDSSLLGIQLEDNGADIIIESAVTDTISSSKVAVLVLGAESFTQYFCVADNGFGSETSSLVDLIQAGNYMYQLTTSLVAPSNTDLLGPSLRDYDLKPIYGNRTIDPSPF